MLRPQKEAFDKTSNEIYSTKLMRTVRPQKELSLEAKLKKFTVFQGDAERQAELDKQIADEEKKRRQQEHRSLQINKLQSNAGFMEEWNMNNIEVWARNRKKRAESENRDLQFKLRQAEKVQASTIRAIHKAKVEQIDEIEQFERTHLRKPKPAAPVVVSPQPKAFPNEARTDGFGAPAPVLEQDQAVGFQTFTAAPQTVGLGSTMGGTGAPALGILKNIARRKKMNEIAKADRDSRTRKLMTQQRGKVVALENYEKEVALAERMERKSRQEEQLNYEIWRTQNTKTIIVENRKMREEKFQKRRELDTEVAVMKEAEALKALRDAFHADTQTALEREKETELARQKAKRERHKAVCEDMVRQLITLSEEAYTHQQKRDALDFDQRNWHEWIELFVEGYPAKVNSADQYRELVVKDLGLAATPGPSESQKNMAAAPTSELGEQPLSALSEPAPYEMAPEVEQGNAYLNQLEFEDYLHNRGQWGAHLVADNKPDLEQLAERLAGAGGAPGKPGGAGGKPKDAAASALDPQENEIPSEAPQSSCLGDAVKTLINLNYRPREEPELPAEVPNHLPLKICLVGRDFSGKETQAHEIARRYNLKVMILNDMIEEALKCVNAPVKEPLSARRPRSELDTGRVSSPEQEGRLRAVGEKIRDSLMLGNDIPDELYVELVVGKICENFRAKSAAEDEAERMQKCERMVDLMEAMDAESKVPQSVLQSSFISDRGGASKSDTVSVKLSEIRVDDGGSEAKHEPSFEVAPDIGTIGKNAPIAPGGSYKDLLGIGPGRDLKELGELAREGWVLVDFPVTLNQAMLLEKALTNYSYYKQHNEREEHLREAEEIAPPRESLAEEERKEPQTRPSGVDALIWLETSSKECLRRALGRRYDRDSDRTYHLEDNPPPTDQSPLVEQLTSANEHARAEGAIVDRHLSFRNEMRWLKRWSEKFENKAIGVPLLHQIGGAAGRYDVTGAIEKVVEAVLASKEQQEAAKCKPVVDLLIEMKRQKEKEAELERQREEQRRAAEEAARLREEAGEDEDSKQEEGAAPPAAAAPSAPPTAPAEEESREKGAAGERAGSPSAGAGAGAEPELYGNIDADFKPILMELWHNTLAKYKENMRRSFFAIREARELSGEAFKRLQLEFLKYLKRVDNKQQLLDKFVSDFNTFSDAKPDMREDEETKDELHQRCDSLCDEMSAIVEARREENVEERRRIMTSGWVEAQIEQLLAVAGELMQTEVDRFRNSHALLTDYFSAIQDRLVPGLPETGVQADVAVGALVQLDGEDALLPVEQLPEVGFEMEERAGLLEQAQYPRLDKLYERALRAQLPQEEKADAAGGGKKAAGGAKKGGDKKGAEEEVEQKLSRYDEELKEGVLKEREILRFRLTLIRNWALGQARGLRGLAEATFEKLENWVRVAIKAENDAIFALALVIKEAIEGHTKLQDELRISLMDFEVDSGIATFIEPPPEPYPAREVPQPARFPVLGLNSLIGQIRAALADGLDQVQIASLLALFQNLRVSRPPADHGRKQARPASRTKAWCPRTGRPSPRRRSRNASTSSCSPTLGKPPAPHSAAWSTGSTSRATWRC